MNKKPTVPVCKSFLSCRKVIIDPQFHDTNIIGLCSHYQHHRYPATVTVGIFARLGSAHGEYRVEVQVQTMQGEIVWKEGPEESWLLDDPLCTYDLRFNIGLVFPKPGPYELVLLVNGEEIARERFNARLKERLADRE